MRLLLIEDDEMALAAMRWALEDLGVEVRVAASGREAIGAIAAFRPEVVVLDISLPDVPGSIVAHSIRDAWPGLPIILTSGHPHEHPDVQASIVQSKSVFLQKPYEVSTLLAAAQQLTDHKTPG